MSIADPNKTILTGENPFIRLSPKDGEPNSTEASYWRIILMLAPPWFMRECAPALPPLRAIPAAIRRRGKPISAHSLPL